MRFSIRDLLWLTALVALAATIYTDRLRTSRLERKWAVERAQVASETAAAIARMQSQVSEVRAQNLLQEHRFNVQLAAERKHYARELERMRSEAATVELRFQQAAAAAAQIESGAVARE